MEPPEPTRLKAVCSAGRSQDAKPTWQERRLAWEVGGSAVKNRKKKKKKKKQVKCAHVRTILIIYGFVVS